MLSSSGHARLQPRRTAVRAQRRTPSVKAMAAIKGMPLINVVWKVPASDEADVDAFWKGHEEWMRKEHVMGLDGDDASKPRMLKFYISKGKEFVDPMDPSKGETGDLLYVMSEVYVAPEGIASHMSKAGAEWPGMEKFPELTGKYGVFVDVGATSVLTSFGDDAATMPTKKGEPCIHVVWRVPASEEAEIDAFWAGHEEWMRKSHVVGYDGDDAEMPRITSFTISKGKELTDPMDASKGETGNLLYVMSETYVAPEGIASHMSKAGAEWPGMEKFPELTGKYGVFMDVGATSVFTSFA